MDTPEAPPPPNPRSSSNGLFFALIPIVLVSIGIFFFLSRKGPPPSSEEASAFNLDEIPTDDGSATHYVSKFEQQAARRNAGAGPGLAGFVPEQDKAFAKGGAPGASGSAPGDEKAARLKEEEFIKKWDKHIQAELNRYGKISSRYRKSDPIVKEVDLAFGKLPRYMALRAQYAKDRNAFAFVRNAIKLPEVRGVVRKYALKPETWRAAIGMSNEALQKKPPQPIYDQAVHFMTHDKTMTKFVTDTTTWLAPQMGNVMMNGIPPGTDLSALEVVASDIGVKDLADTKGASAGGRRSSSKRR
ncbi:MAG: hypothetical protein CO113_18175 [Elusimicrobia bacterium CG_4_9_14_3_um_filter_62_55]|nr:MAG: hypothetical protein COR54_04190 [Elusimicrobia bacterium CG22_combo_CG10-13_8_21_14_all_63_91]PJA18624.1 MAG: hypothetical protein COX66_00460 [Elusimicrobia bacterium CG_4_10_14_0_2_um_filter_63_34]PJB23368.1 MAG: hypothetical protein CO113_18175 [Elusimicrobia bacterium CG_4_9_14_3_um_filter_62_55]